MKNYRNGKLIIVILLLATTVYTQSREYSIKSLSLEDGLSQSSVYSIIQDKQGFMWFATEDGLNKYDGYQFTVYKNKSFDKNSLSENSVYSIDEGASGVLWISTWSTGLNRYDVKKNKFTRFTSFPDDSNSLSSDLIYELSFDNSGSVWIATNNGLNRLDTATNQFKHFHHDPNDEYSIISNSVSKLVVDSDDNVIAACEGGLSIYNPQKGTFSNFKNRPDNPGSLVNNDVQSLAVCKVNPNTVWAGTVNGGIEKINTKTGVIEHLGHGYIKGIPSDVISAIETDYKGNIWIGTSLSGLFVLNPETKRLKNFTQSYIDKNSISHNNIYSIYVSKSGIIWVGTGSAGINIINKKIKNFKWYRENDDPNKMLSNNVVAGLMEDQNNNLWICGWNSGLTIMNLKSGAIRLIKKDTKGNKGLNSNSVVTTFEMDDGRIGVTTADGLNIYDPRTKRFEYIKKIPGNVNSLADNYVMTGLEDRDGIIWLGFGDKGLDRWDMKTGHFTHYQHDKKNPESIIGDEIYIIYEDKKGDIWISAQRAGVSVFNKKNGHFRHYVHDENNPRSLGSNDIMVIYQASDGTMWLGSYGAGLNKLNPVDNTFISYKEEDGLPNNVVYGILEDDAGCLWLSTNKGISRFNPETEEFRNYDVSDGLQSDEFNSSFCKTSSGEMFFGGINGLNSFYPQEIIDNSFVAPVYITNLQILNKDIIANEEFSGREILKYNISYTKQIELNHNDYLVNFEFASLNYINSPKNQYAYKLEGFDKDWNYSKNIRFATYRNLPPAEYTFRVKGSNNDNIWNDKETSLRVVIVPAFWQTWWFRSFIFILLIFVLILYYKSRTKAIKSQNSKLEKAVKLKTSEMEILMEKMIRQEKLVTIGKISGSIAHELRNPLGAVKQSAYYLKMILKDMPGKVEKHLNLIEDELNVADRVIDDLMEMTRIKSANKTMISISEIINDSVQRVNLNGQADIQMEIADNATHIWADLIQMRQVLVNLISNASQAFEQKGRIVIASALTENGNFIRLSIMDNGPGIKEDFLEKIFEPLYTTKAKGTGLGLNICKQIIEKHDGDITISSDPGKGTKVDIILPYKNEEEMKPAGD